MLEKAYYQSEFGCFEIMGSPKGIRSVRLSDKEKCPDLPVPEILQDCVTQLDEYFNRKRQNFDLTFDWSGAPPFHVAVWKELVQIPYGRTTSYGWIAEKLGDPKSVRAVGQANKNNKIAIIVPCHRVIAKSGDLHGYFYGLDMKRKLLEIENPMSFGEQGSLF